MGPQPISFLKAAGTSSACARRRSPRPASLPSPTKFARWISHGVFRSLAPGAGLTRLCIVLARIAPFPEAYRSVYVDGLLNALAGIKPRQMLITGSTSVYAQTDGSWVDETSEARPDRETGRILLEAEAIALRSGGFVARLSGLYGPGRSVLMRKFLSGEAVIEGDGLRWINQVHRDDAAKAVVHLLTETGASGHIQRDRQHPGHSVHGLFVAGGVLSATAAREGCARP